MEKSENVISKINSFLAIIVMKEEFDLIVEKDKYEIDSDFTNLHKEVLISYKKKFTFNEKSVEGIILTGTVDKLHKLSPVGSEVAYLLAYLGIKYYNPDVVLNCGYAGCSGLNKLFRGDIVLSTNKASYYLRKCIIPIYDPFVKGGYPVFDSTKIAESLGFKSGVVGTSDSFVESDGGVSKEVGASCIEMEFCAIARTCYTLNKQCIGIKIISDGDVDPDKSEEQRELGKSLNLYNIFSF